MEPITIAGIVAFFIFLGVIVGGIMYGLKERKELDKDLELSKCTKKVE